MNDWLLRPEDLEGLGIRTVIIATPDLQGRLVGRRVPTRNFGSIIKNGVDVCTCVWAWDIEQGLDLIEAGLFPLCTMHNGIPDATLRPDLNTLRRAAWLSGVAICMADPYVPGTDTLLDISPRVQLRRELERYERTGIVPAAGTELEFYLYLNEPAALRRGGFRDLEPTTAYSCDFGIQEGNAYEPFFQQLRDDLEASGIGVEAAQSEHGHGQWEMTFRYGEPLAMADQHALYKLAVRDAATKAGMSATFMPAPRNGQPGSSCHIHLSLRGPEGEFSFWDENADDRMSPMMRSAVEGTLEHAPGLTLWFAPTVNSYRRHRGDGVAGLGNSWALADRTATVRVLGHAPEQMRFEFRTPGADANPYLALLGLLGAARDGIERNLELRAPHNPRVEATQTERLPSNLGAAVSAFADSSLAAILVGKDVRHHHAVLAEHEWETFLSAVSDWDLHRYFDRI